MWGEKGLASHEEDADSTLRVMGNTKSCDRVEGLTQKATVAVKMRTYGSLDWTPVEEAVRNG